MLLLCQMAACFVGRGPSLAGKVDLRAFYAAGTIIRSGHGSQLYDYDYQAQVQNAVVGVRPAPLPFLYPSFAALPFVLLSLVSYKSAFCILAAVNLFLLLFAAFLLRPWLPCFRSLGSMALPALYCCLFGVSVALVQGQLSFILLVIYCGAWVSLKMEQPFLAGLLLSIGLIKFQIAIPIVVLFFLWKKWRVVAGFLLGLVGLAGISLTIVGTSGALAYWKSMAGMTKQTAFNAASAKAHYGMFPVDMPNLHGLTFGLTHGASWGLILNVVLCCAVLAFAARQQASLLVALPAAMLVSYHMQPHDLTLLLLPLSFEVDALLRRLQRRRSGDLHATGAFDIVLLCCLLLLILPLASVLMGSGLNYLVSLAVCGVMVVAARMDLQTVATDASLTQNSVPLRQQTATI